MLDPYFPSSSDIDELRAKQASICCLEQLGAFAPVMEVFMRFLLHILARLYSTPLQLSCTAQSPCQVKQLRLFL